MTAQDIVTAYPDCATAVEHAEAVLREKSWAYLRLKGYTVDRVLDDMDAAYEYCVEQYRRRGGQSSGRAYRNSLVAKEQRRHPSFRFYVAAKLGYM